MGYTFKRKQTENSQVSEIPTNTSELNNDSGYITDASVVKKYVKMYYPSIHFGGSYVAKTTDEFLSILEAFGAFNDYAWVARGSWSYASNCYISDTGFGILHLAGCFVEVYGLSKTQCTIRITTPTTSTAGECLKSEFIYINNGSAYQPGWRKCWNSANDGSGSGLDADTVKGYTPVNKAGDTITGDLTLQQKLIMNDISKHYLSNVATYRNVARLNPMATTNTGTICITVPTKDSMIDMDIEVRSYTGVMHIHFSGYIYSSGTTWYQPQATRIQSGFANVIPNIRVANAANGTRVILIGATSFSWGGYLHISVTRVTVGYGHANDLSTGWSIALITDESTYTNIATVPVNYYWGLTYPSISNPYFGGTSYFQDSIVNRPLLQDYGEKSTANTAATGAVTLDIANGNNFELTITGATTLTISNPTGTGNACSITIKLTFGATLYGITWPASVKWNGDVAPTFVASKVAIITLVTFNGGTRWHGAMVGNNFAI